MTAPDESGRRESVTLPRDLADQAARDLIAAGEAIETLRARVAELEAERDDDAPRALEAAVAAFAVVGFGVVVLAVLWALGRVLVAIGGVL